MAHVDHRGGVQGCREVARDRCARLDVQAQERSAAEADAVDDVCNIRAGAEAGRRLVNGQRWSQATDARAMRPPPLLLVLVLFAHAGLTAAQWSSCPSTKRSDVADDAFEIEELPAIGPRTPRSICGRRHRIEDRCSPLLRPAGLRYANSAESMS